MDKIQSFYKLRKNKFCHLASFSPFIQLDIFLIYFDFMSEIV